MARARTATAIRFEPELHEHLVVYADALGVPINWLVNQAVREYVASLPPPDQVEIKLTRTSASSPSLPTDRLGDGGDSGDQPLPKAESP